MSKNKNVVKAEGGKSNVGIYIVSIILALLSILPFWIMIANATRQYINQIQQQCNFIDSVWGTFPATMRY